MLDLTKEIAQADSIEIEKCLKAIRKRYGDLFPDWEVCTVSIQRSADRNAQLDRLITMLQNMKDPG